MKTRIGFVSNSSSSSFIVSIRTKEPQDKLLMHNNKIALKAFGEELDPVEYEKGEKLIAILNIAYGSDEGDDPETIITKIMTGLGIKEKDIIIRNED